jgi:iron complex transport system substrate-binding protein
MKASWLFSRALALCLLAAVPARAGDVVSLNLCTDAVLLTLAPERIAALSPLARDPSLSVAASAAASLPWVRPEAEAVLALHPALVLASRYGAQSTVALLRARGVAVVTLGEPADLAGVDQQVRDAAAALGVAARGRAVLADFHARLAAIRPRPPVQAVLWEARGFSAGPGSFGGDVLRAAGLINAGTGGAMDVETLVARHPGLLVTQTAPGYPSLATDMLWHPALAGLHRATLRPAWLACPGPWSIAAVEALTR